MCRNISEWFVKVVNSGMGSRCDYNVGYGIFFFVGFEL